MASRVLFLVVLVSICASVQCKVKGWPPGWSWSHPDLTDDEIVDLLYTDPEKLRQLTAGYEDQGGFDVSQDISIPSTGPSENNDYNSPPSQQVELIHSDQRFQTGQATSFTRVQHFTPKRGPSEDLLSYSQHIVH
ncbi:uncharacterized protein [Halyomorpha halys]|uniref:uncharacterized protein n=1 Tax=Halyomorpha halys TaxID=286706 RepID=UPI0006D526F8|nr:uncharacterized protein LOC106691224 [Halyomorpha halys]